MLSSSRDLLGGERSTVKSPAIDSFGDQVIGFCQYDSHAYQVSNHYVRRIVRFHINLIVYLRCVPLAAPEIEPSGFVEAFNHHIEVAPDQGLVARPGDAVLDLHNAPAALFLYPFRNLAVHLSTFYF